MFTSVRFLWLTIVGIFLTIGEVKSQAPTAPINLTAISETSSRIRLNWQDQSSNESYFIIERAQDTDDNFVPVDSVGADTTKYIDIDLTAETTYFYRIKATNANGASAYSNTIGASTVPVTSLEETALNKAIKAFPIPTLDYLTIEVALKFQQPLPYTLFNIQGRAVQTGVLKNQSQLDLRRLSKGLYFLMIQAGKKRITRKVLRN